MDKWLENEYASWKLEARIYSGQEGRRSYDLKFREEMIVVVCGLYWVKNIWRKMGKCQSGATAFAIKACIFIIEGEW